MGKNTLRVAILNAILLMGGTMAYPETAYAQGQAQTYSIAAGDLESVLSRFGTESRIQLIYPPELLKGKRSNGLTGNFAPMEALRQLLQGSGLEAERVNDRTVVIKRAAAAPAAKPQTAPRGVPATTQAMEPEVQDLGKMTVTGTRIRGGTSPSPTIVMDEVQFQQEGFTDLGEVIRSIPQNFRGGQNPGVTTGASQGVQTNQNITGGSALNLRGLGSDATLTLLNGRRLSYSGYSQSVDISAIPIDAVERMEIVPDGASAIYGSDAVGGVANVVLKRDFDGVTVGALYGDSTDGGLARHDYFATAGTTWNSGGLIATFKKSAQDPIYADQRAYTQAMEDPTTIYNGSTLRSGLVSGHQLLGENAELHLDAFHTVRTQTAYFGYAARYDYGRMKTTNNTVAPSLDISLPGEWSLIAAASFGENETIHNTSYVTGETSTLQSSVCYCNKTRAWELGTEGPLLKLGQREIRLAAGIGGRVTDFVNRSSISGDRGGDERSSFAYGELSLPIVGRDNARPGMRRLEFTGAVRAEDYDTFGGVTTPKLGVIYDPTADFTIKASWGRSFKAPTLLQQHERRTATLYLAEWLDCGGCSGDATVLMSAGGNRDLQPERARTWTTSLSFHPETVPGLEVELTYFAINYTQRVLRPIPNIAGTLSDPAYTPFIEYNPSTAQLQQILGDADVFQNGTGAEYDPSKVIAIASNQYTNVARQRARGLDLTGSYSVDLATGNLTLRGGVSWLDISQQTLPGDPQFDVSGMIYRPAEVNGRFGAVWGRDNFSVAAFANYTSGVTSELGVTRQNVASFTTFDTTFRYETSAGDKAWSGLTLSVSVDNLFNRSPPLYTPPSLTYAPYDSTNYSAIGRYLAVSVSKHW